MPAVDADARVLQLFLGGVPYPAIAQALGLDEGAVHVAVIAQLKGSAERREVLDRNQHAVAQERTEALFRSHWGAALRGDHKSAELCRRILERQSSAGSPVRIEGDAVDEIAARRASRRASTTSRAARAKRSS